MFANSSNLKVSFGAHIPPFSSILCKCYVVGNGEICLFDSKAALMELDS